MSSLLLNGWPITGGDIFATIYGLFELKEDCDKKSHFLVTENVLLSSEDKKYVFISKLRIDAADSINLHCTVIYSIWDDVFSNSPLISVER